MRILEAGHYYLAKGPTLWSTIGWHTVMPQIFVDTDKTILFVDDVHALENVWERELPNIDFDPEPDHLLTESVAGQWSWEALELLKQLPKKKAAKANQSRWYCSGVALTTSDGQPTCVLYDAGLTLWKSRHYSAGVNILPYYYEAEQRVLLHLVKKIIPDFDLQIILYDLNGVWWYLE